MKRDRERSATLADVARHAGVSTATVSRCINLPDQVKPERRARVEAAIAALGYIPHLAAKDLASRRSRMIGAVFPRLNSILFGSFFGRLQQSLDAVGYFLVVSTSEYSAAIEERQVRQLIARGVDALVLVGHHHGAGTLEILERSGIPRIHTWAWQDGAQLPQIGFCNRAAMGQVADYVLGLGHRRIAVISGELRDNDRAHERLEGARLHLAAMGLPLEDGLIEEIPFDIDEGAAAFSRLMDLADRPTAVLCGSDLFAFGALREARRRGLRVPADVTVIGFDDTEFAPYTEPPLTSLRTPREAMADRTAQALIAALDDDRKIRSIRLETELVIRASSGAPASRPARMAG